MCCHYLNSFTDIRALKVVNIAAKHSFLKNNLSSLIKWLRSLY